LPQIQSSQLAGISGNFHFSPSPCWPTYQLAQLRNLEDVKNEIESGTTWSIDSN